MTRGAKPAHTRTPGSRGAEGANGAHRACRRAHCSPRHRTMKGMEPETDYRAAVREASPAPMIRTFRPGPSGQFNRIFITNEKVVFRFPRYAEGAQRLSIQVAILRAIRDHVPLPVPEPISASPAAGRPGVAFVGYPLLPGVPLAGEPLQSLDSGERAHLAAELGTFLRALHSVSPSAVQTDLPHMDSRDRWADLYRRIRSRLFQHMRPEARSQVARHFEAFIDQPDTFAYEPVIRHGDFGPENVLYDPTTRRVTGIIDFDFAGLGDPAVDLSVVVASGAYGEGFGARLSAVYPVTNSALSCCAFYRRHGRCRRHCMESSTGTGSPLNEASRATGDAGASSAPEMHRLPYHASRDQ
ncbi:MAG: phosphotransferase [Chloroflexi bacterium]|nr:phosphotransferase [Chloroflexota bacterium]